MADVCARATDLRLFRVISIINNAESQCRDRNHWYPISVSI